MNYRPSNNRLLEYNHLDDDGSLSSERTNYSSYLSRQLNRFKDATMNRSSYPKRLSTPLRNTNWKFYPSEEEIDFADNEMIKYTNGRNPSGKYSERPRSFTDYNAPPSTNMASPYRYNALDSVYHDYVNYCPTGLGQHGESEYPSYNNVKPFHLLPEYEDPPDYALHRQRRLEQQQRSSRYSALPENVPPLSLVFKGNLNTQKRSRNEETDGHSLNFMRNVKNSDLGKGKSPFSFDYNHSNVDKPQICLRNSSPQNDENNIVVQNQNGTILQSSIVPRDSSQDGVSIARGNPPPYHSHHEILDQGSTMSQSCHRTNLVPNLDNPRISDSCEIDYCAQNDQLDLQVVLAKTSCELCNTVRPANSSCKNCSPNGNNSSNSNSNNNSAIGTRATYRKNAASLVRRASSGASLLKRKSVKLRSSFHTEVDLEETPSILSRLRKEWQDRRGGSKSTGNIPTYSEGKLSNPPSTASLASIGQSKSSENLRIELTSFSHNLSKETYTITENQTMEGKTIEQHVHCNNNPSSPMPVIKTHSLSPQHSTEDSSQKTTNKATYKFSSSADQSKASLSADEGRLGRQEVVQPPPLDDVYSSSQSTDVERYYDVDISDSGSSYDTLIIKDLASLNPDSSQFFDNSKENCNSQVISQIPNRTESLEISN